MVTPSKQAAGAMLVVARLRPERAKLLSQIGAARGLLLVSFEDVPSALEWLQQHSPRVVLFDSRVARAEEVCARVRSRRDLAAVPIIALNADARDSATAHLYAVGADDVVPLTSGASIVARVRALPGPRVEPSPSRGTAIVADPEPARCDVIGRTLMNAGYEVRYAIDERGLVYYASEHRPALIVAAAELVSVPALIEDVRRGNPGATWVLTCPPRTLNAMVQATRELPRVGVTGSQVPPEDLVFLANSLNSEGDQYPPRESTRLLYGTSVAFRAPGSDEDELGFTYNVSAAGMYIRTLAQPEGDRVWLELRPPRSKQRVRLEATVVWRTPFGFSEAATAPPGFAVHLTHGLGDGLEVWGKAYAAFARAAQPHVGGSLADLLAETLEEAGLSSAVEGEEVSGITELPQGGSLAAAPPSDGEPPSGQTRVANPPPLPAPEPSAEPEPAPAQPSVAMNPAAVQPAPAAAARPPREPTKPASWVAPLGGALLVAAGLIGLAWWRGAAPEVDSGEELPRGAATGSRTSPAKAAPSAAPRPPSGAPRPTAQAAAATSRAEPSSAVSARVSSPTSAPTPQGNAAPAEPEPPLLDLTQLGPSEAFLTVASTAAAHVYVHGAVAGLTNQPIKTRCGSRFVRLSADAGARRPAWITRGRAMPLKCGASNVIRMDPD